MLQFPTHKLGKNGPQVPVMGFGLMGLSAVYGQVGSDEGRMKVLDRAYELGERFWDSADAYADSEDLVGKWFKRTGKRDEVFDPEAVHLYFLLTLIVSRSSLPPNSL